MGFLSRNTCFETSAQAVDAFYSEAEILFAEGGGSNDELHFFINNAGVWYFDEYTVSGAGVFTQVHHGVLPVPTFASCTFQPELTASEKFTDGATLGWGVVAVMVFAWGVMQMRKAW